MSDNKLSNLKNRIPKLDMSEVKEKGFKLLALIRRFITLIILVSMFAGGFFIGARMHELGHLEGILGKDLKGSSVMVSGPCQVGGDERIPALAEDEVKVTSIQDGTLVGVVRKTREVVTCDLSKIAIDKLPLLANIGKTPAKIPELKEMTKTSKEVAPYKMLENKVLLVSGSCRNQLDAKELPPFTDERVDVTSVEASKENSQIFLISGIRRSDKVALVCSSKAIKYSLTDGSEPVAVGQIKVPVSFKGKIITVTSRCVPDPRIVPTPRGSDGRKMAFFRLVNSPVQVIEETIKDDRLVKFTGTIVDKKIDKAAYGQMTICDESVYPMTYELYDFEDVNLDQINEENKKKEDSVTGSEVLLEEEEKKNDAKVKNVPILKGGRLPNKVIKKQIEESKKAEEATRVVTPIQVEEVKAESNTLPVEITKDADQSKEDLLKQLDGGNNE